MNEGRVMTLRWGIRCCSFLFSRHAGVSTYTGPCSASTLCRCPLAGGTQLGARLEGAVARLLVDVAEALALLAVLEDHGEADDEEGVDADEAEDGGEDVVEEDVGEGRHGADAAALQGGGGGRLADVIRDEGWRGAIEVATAIELFMVSTGCSEGGLCRRTHR